MDALGRPPVPDQLGLWALCVAQPPGPDGSLRQLSWGSAAPELDSVSLGCPAGRPPVRGHVPDAALSSLGQATNLRHSAGLGQTGPAGLRSGTGPPWIFERLRGPRGSWVGVPPRQRTTRNSLLRAFR